jgi:hypothetical protein
MHQVRTALGNGSVRRQGDDCCNNTFAHGVSHVGCQWKIERSSLRALEEI